MFVPSEEDNWLVACTRPGLLLCRYALPILSDTYVGCGTHLARTPFGSRS
jgi:hypothetical protein